MKITQMQGSSAYQTHLHLALLEAVAKYAEAWQQISQSPPLTEESATPELTVLHYSLEQKRATALLLGGACVEALANLYLALKTTADQFAVLQRATFIEKWTVVPSLFLPRYVIRKDSVLYQDLKRLHSGRNALAHLKEEVTSEGVVIHRPSVPERTSDEHVFIGRCATLPSRLVEHLGTFDHSDAMIHLGSVVAFPGAFRAVIQRLTGA